MTESAGIAKKNWVGIVVGVALVAAIAAGIIASRAGDPKVVIGSNDEVYYYRRATKEDARALGEALKSTGFFNGRGTSVLLWRGGGEPTVVSFVVDDGAWTHPNAIANFTEIGRRIANSVGGFPLRVHLTDAGRVVHLQMTVGKIPFGKDVMYYFGSATEADARALAQALQSAGYFADRGVTVALLKGEGTAISFVVQDGIWDQADAMVTLDHLVRQVAGSVGGLPVKLKLLNREMESKREMEIR
jgi:hypothetical protein